MVQRLKVNQFYGAPTAIRLLLKYGDEWVQKYDRSSLKTLGSGMPNIRGCLRSKCPLQATQYCLSTVLLTVLNYLWQHA